MFKISYKKSKVKSKTLLSETTLQNLRVFATTVIRGSQNSELTGFLVELDWKNNKVKQKIPIPIDTKHPLWNERGGNRGGRGLFVYDKTLYVATALSILKFDKDLNQIGTIEHSYLAGLHEIYIDSEGIWLTSTVHDLILKVDFDGNLLKEWWGSESSILQKELKFSQRTLNLNLNFSEENFVADYQKYCGEERLHINTVWVDKNQIYILSNSRNAFVKIFPKPETIIVQDKELRSPHNGIITPDGRILINDTQNQCIRVYESSGKRIKTINTSISSKHSIMSRKSFQLSQQFAKPGWQRGLTHIRDSIYLVGTSPATVFEVDIDKEIIGQQCKIDDDVKHCIHGLVASSEL